MVASTNVYGSIATAIGGDHVKVTSIITSPDRDPHEYEADVQNQLALSQADVVIENGAGYDDFVDTMLTASPRDGRVVVDVADVSGYDQEPATGGFNEHVWYDFPTVLKLVDQLSADFAAADPAHAADYTANATSYRQSLQKLIATEAMIKKTHPGAGVAITEPVPLYLLQASGLVNRTPPEFSEAIEEETDVPPAVLAQTIALFTDHKVDLLAYNEQTVGPETEKVLAAAKAADVAVVPVTETLPEGQDYLSWMTANLAAVQQALDA